MSISELLRRPSAYLPVAASAGAIVTIAAQIAVSGTAPQADEGAAAHVWQLLMVLQLPLVALFAVRWLPRAPRQALAVLALQAGCIAAAMAPVAFLHW